MHDLYDVPGAEFGARVLRSRHDFSIAFDRHGTLREPQEFDQGADAHAAGNLANLAIYGDLHRGFLFLLWGVGQVKRASVAGHAGKRLAQRRAGR